MIKQNKKNKKDSKKRNKKDSKSYNIVKRKKGIDKYEKCSKCL